jgi:pilus assembly protein Flp/PilA
LILLVHRALFFFAHQKLAASAYAWSTPWYETVGALGRIHDGWTSGRGEKRGETAIRKFLKDESGATAIEYGLIAALLSIIVITGALSVGGSLGGLYTMVSSKVTTAIP